MNSIAERLRILRGTTSRAAYAKQYGIHAQTLLKYENGERTPSVDLIQAICRQQEVLVEWLIFGTGKMLSTDDISSTTSKNSLIPTIQHSEYAQLQKELSEERTERRELARELRETNAENRKLWKEIGELKEKLGNMTGFKNVTK